MRADQPADPRGQSAPGLVDIDLLDFLCVDDKILGRTRGSRVKNLLPLSAYRVGLMSRLQRITNIFAVVLPFLAFLAAIVLLWNSAVGWTDLAIVAAMYLVTALGITIGYHRMLTHRAFQTYKPVEYAFAAAGSMAVQGPVIDWVADHRKHHAHTDEEGDPHSPHVGHGSGLARALARPRRLAVRRQRPGRPAQVRARTSWRTAACGCSTAASSRSSGLSLGLPFALGWLLTGTLAGALTGLLWGGLVRIFFVHHITWSINSICHFHGRRRFATDDHSTNVWWLSLASLGEAWHHNHHAFPRSAVPRPAPLGARPVRRDHPRDAARSASPGTW